VRKLTLLLILATLLVASIGQPTPTQAQTPPLTLKECTFPLGVGSKKTEIPAQCATLSVLEDRKNPNGHKIDIPIYVLPPTTPGAKGLPIFHLEGGPGGSAINGFGQSWFLAYSAFRKDHPVVVFDQRGIGKSGSLQCTEVTDEALKDLALTPASAVEESNQSLGRIAACLQRLSKTADPQFYTSTAAADDMDEIRLALGYDQILVFGNSYGTWLGQYYLKLHGEHVAGMVLDSVTGPWNRPDLLAAASGQASLDKIIKLCEADPLCNQTYPNLHAKLDEALAQLEKAPVKTSGVSGITAKTYPVGMTADRLRSTLFMMLYSTSNSVLIPQAITEAARGIYQFPATVLASQAEEAAEFISYGLNLSVTCAESVPFFTDELIAQYATESFLLGSKDDYKESFKPQIAACKAWRSAELSEADVAPITSNRPVLILSGNLDPITPVAFGEETQKRLKNSTLVVLPYQGHGVIIGSKCAQDVTAAFFNNPTGKIDASCTKDDLVPLFTGAIKPEFEPLNDPKASVTGIFPKGWKQEPGAPLSFATSPDGLQLAAIGVYKDTDEKTARAAVLKALAEKYGAVAIQQEITQDLLIVRITVIAHGLERPNQSTLGILYIRPDGKNVLVAWQAAPLNWFQAVTLAYGPQLLVSIRPR
jgi:pimeloyl-ACP methyl ester carboxylesterase